MITRLKSEELKLSIYIKEFKESIEKKAVKEQESAQKSTADEQKIEKQLEKELENAKVMLKNYQT